jgi:undecaprenyl-diphosphatase
MFSEIILSIFQAATEFFPVSSSGHLALISNLISQPNLFFFTMLHIASLFAILIFTRNEIKSLFKFDENARKMWLYLIIATIPALIFGYFFSGLITSSLYSLLFLGGAFIFTGFILLMTKFAKPGGKLTANSSLFIGLFQVLALFPGVSRSGMTISAGLFSGVEKEKATKFSFLLFIPLALGAFVFELGEFYIDFTLILAFLITFFLSIFFLNLLLKVVKLGKIWWFSIYCFLIGIISLIFHFV